MKHSLNVTGVQVFMEQVTRRLEESHLGVFASIGEEGAKARTVDYVNVGPCVGFFSWRNSEKIGEIEQTPWVSFCVNEIQIEGIAYIKPLDDPCIGEFLSRYEGKLSNLYSKFITLPEIVFIIIEPKRIKRMVVEQNALHIERCHVETGELLKEKLSDW